MHTNHPDSHEHGLADGCPRCAEHAEHPLRTLDARNLQRLVAQALTPDRLSLPVSETDLVATAKVLTAMEQTGALFECAPALMAQYLRERWRVPVFMLDENLVELTGFVDRVIENG